MSLSPNTLQHDAIAALIPHSGNMCLLSQMQEWSVHKIVCSANNHRDPDHPLRTRGGLLACTAIEYAAQAMALHGALTGRAAGMPATPGYLASARQVKLHVLRLDELPPSGARADELQIEATRLAGDAQQILYAFEIRHIDRPVAQGRTAVVLNTRLV